MQTNRKVYSSFQKKERKEWILLYAFHFIYETHIHTNTLVHFGKAKKLNVFDKKKHVIVAEKKCANYNI